MIRRVALAAAAVALAACEAMNPPAPPPAPASVASLYQLPGERALILGLSLYEQASFERAEQSLQAALRAGLRSPLDTATAYKYLAFIACAFNRLDECDQRFRSAFGADAGFRLTDAEIGHPIWGPVYRRVAAATASGRK